MTDTVPTTPIFDTHCHYNLAPLHGNWRQHQHQALAAGVTQTLVVGTTLATSQLAVELTNSHSQLYATLGIHPTAAAKHLDLAQASTTLTKLYLAHQARQQVLAIGEVGLDYFRLPTAGTARTQAIAEQQQLFVAMIKLAKQLQLPLVLHLRDQGEQAYTDALHLLQQHWDFQRALILHCVSGPDNYLQTALALPHTYFGFDGNLTFKNAKRIREIFQLIQSQAPDKILLETDAPYLAPEPHRGQTCEPAMIALTAAFAHKQLGADLGQIYTNSLRAFGL